MMSAFDDIMRAAREEKERRKNRKEWEVLKDKILHVSNANEIIALQKEIDNYMDSDASIKDKEQLSGYLECYYMKLDAVVPGGILAAGIFELEDEAELTNRNE